MNNSSGLLGKIRFRSDSTVTPGFCFVCDSVYYSEQLAGGDATRNLQNLLISMHIVGENNSKQLAMTTTEPTTNLCVFDSITQMNYKHGGWISC